VRNNKEIRKTGKGTKTSTFEWGHKMIENKNLSEKIFWSFERN
jgi:hypothetical protein